jgi:hypothetical protein
MNTGHPRPRTAATSGMRGRPRACGRALVMAHQIDLFCIPQLADARRLEADQNGGYACGRAKAEVALRDRLPGSPDTRPSADLLSWARSSRLTDSTLSAADEDERLPGVRRVATRI